jgi:hypothetical protein
VSDAVAHVNCIKSYLPGKVATVWRSTTPTPSYFLLIKASAQEVSGKIAGQGATYGFL